MVFCQGSGKLTKNRIGVDTSNICNKCLWKWTMCKAQMNCKDCAEQPYIYMIVELRVTLMKEDSEEKSRSKSFGGHSIVVTGC